MSMPADTKPSANPVPLPDCMMPDGAEPCAALKAIAAERDAALAQVAVLRRLLDRCEGWIGEDHPYWEVGKLGTLETLHAEVKTALTDTEAAAKEYERELRNRALQEVADKADAEAEKFGVAQSHKTNAAQKSYLQGIARGLEKAAELARAMKETP